MPACHISADVGRRIEQRTCRCGIRSFSADCVIHINGSPDRNLSVAGFKQMMAVCSPPFADLRLTSRTIRRGGQGSPRDGSRKAIQ